MFRLSSLVVLACVIAFPAVGSRLMAQPPKAADKDLLKPEPGDDELRKLLKERHNAATREYAIYNSRIEIDPLAWILEQMLACNRRRAEVALELFSKPEDQVRILQTLFDEAKKLETVVENRFRAGGVAGALSVDVEKARGGRLDVEIMLVKAKRLAKPASPPVPGGDKPKPLASEPTAAPPPGDLKKAQERIRLEIEKLGKVIESSKQLENEFLKPDPGDDELRKLLKERYSVATREYTIPPRTRREIDPLSPFLNGLCTSSRRRSEIALELFPKPDDQVGILEGLLAQAKQTELVVQNRIRMGGMSGVLPHDYEKVLGARLDVEIMLAKAKRSVSPPK